MSGNQVDGEELHRSERERELEEEAAGKSRTEWQGFLKKKGLPATGTNPDLKERYLKARRVECGLPSVGTAVDHEEELDEELDEVEIERVALSEEELHQLERERELNVETTEKSRHEMQGYLKTNGYPATGTNPVLKERYFEARRVELGLVTADEANLPEKKDTTKKKGTKKLSPEEAKLKADTKSGWQYSDAKAALKAAIMGGEVPLTKPNDENEEDLTTYFNVRPEIANYGQFDKFKGRLNNLRDQIRNDKTRAEEDEEAFLVYVKNHPKQTQAAKGNYPEWEGSPAQSYLEIDMEEGKHTTMKKKRLWKTRAHYMLFPLKVFREHIYQHLRTAKYLNQLRKTDKAGDKWKDFRNPKDEFASDDEADISASSSADSED